MSVNIVRGQLVTDVKVDLAHRLRREMTFAEKILWHRLRNNKLGSHFRRQQVIDGFVADFYCHSAMLIVEADGSVHDCDYDAERDEVLMRRGIMVRRFSNDDIERRVGWVLSEIKKLLTSRQ